MVMLVTALEIINGTVIMMVAYVLMETTLPAIVLILVVPIHL